MSDKPKQLSPFEKAMMYMRAQEKLKECEHDWHIFQMVLKYVSNAATTTGHISRMVSKCVANV